MTGWESFDLWYDSNLHQDGTNTEANKVHRPAGLKKILVRCSMDLTH